MRVETEEKIWGQARHVFAAPHAAVSVLRTKKGGYCSRHSHSQRVNRFIVESGVIEVVEYAPDGENEVCRIRMQAGDVHDVETDVIHRFEVIEPGMVIEVYFPQRPSDRVSHDDIIRLDIGGICSP